MATFTENTATAPPAATAMEEDENKAPPEAAKDATKDGAATPGADGKPTDMTRYVGGEMRLWGVFTRQLISLSFSPLYLHG